VGYPGRGYGWVLARKTLIADADYQSLLDRFREQGYDIGQFRGGPQDAA
jgi:lipocalin